MTSASPSAAPAFPWQTWRMVLVAAAAGIVFYLDRQTVAILKTTISQSLRLTNADFALLISAYMVVSELAPAGTIATTIGILSALSGCASIAFNQAAGFLVDAFGYTALFIAGACLHPIAAVILWRSQQGGAAAALPTRIGSLGTP